MIKAEPRSILLFLYTHFELMRDLFDVQKSENIIRKEMLTTLLDKHGREVRQQLLDYQVLKKNNDDFEMREAYFAMFEFILVQFRPMLPEEVSKFGSAISSLFLKIYDGISGDRNILLERIRSLSQEIRNFSESVEKNSIRLLNETRELKANVSRIDYQQKIQKASFWIEYYISPLNTILDVNHSDSITNKLLDISNFANQKQMSVDDEGVRQAFQQLYFQLRQTNDDLLQQSKILTNDLLPLIERIRTENIILTGWIEFLKNPDRVKPIRMYKTFIQKAYSDKMVFNAREYAEQFIIATNTYLEEEGSVEGRWIFNKTKFREQLIADLPVKDYFSWCAKQLKNDSTQISNDKVFAMTSMLFDEEVEVEFAKEEQIVALRTQTSILNVPKLKLKKNGVSAAS